MCGCVLASERGRRGEVFRETGVWGSWREKDREREAHARDIEKSGEVHVPEKRNSGKR